jgi:hypothetical protein
VTIVRVIATALARVFVFIFAFLVDGWHGLSLTRGMAIYVVYRTMNIEHDAHRISGNGVIVIIACLAAAFGKGVFQFFLLRWRASNDSTDTTVDVTIDETIRKDVDARRDAGKDLGVEASP